jgi:hypothetical protein
MAGTPAAGIYQRRTSYFTLHVALSTSNNDKATMEWLTKRATLVADTLLLSHTDGDTSEA